MPSFVSRLRCGSPQKSKWILVLAIIFIALALTYSPDGLTYFRYDRAAIASGQVWRLVTGHFVHLNAAHLLLNVMGLMLICELLWDRMSVLRGAGLLIVACAGVSGLLWWLQPDLVWYAGLSGVLHGLWAGCALAGWLSLSADTEKFRPAHRYVCLAGLLLLIFKLGAEFFSESSTSTAHIIGAPVVSVAHLYGALTGGLYALVGLGLSQRLIKRLS